MVIFEKGQIGEKPGFAGGGKNRPNKTSQSSEKKARIAPPTKKTSRDLKGETHAEGKLLAQMLLRPEG